MITLRRVAIAFLCLTFGDKSAAALDAQVIFEASEHALAPATSAPAIRLTMQGVYPCAGSGESAGDPGRRGA